MANKTDLIKSVAIATGFNQRDCSRVINAFLEATRSTLDRGEEVKLHEFGTFEWQFREARKIQLYGKNGKEIDVPARYYLTFSAAERFKQAGINLLETMPPKDQ